METITLGSATTTRLGFGGSSIMGALNRSQSLALLESAYDAGIRHFDTAPMYGYGEAESCLGEFVARHLGEVTVATKFGIPPEGRNALRSAGRAIARPLLQAAPGVKKLVRGVLQARRGQPSTAAPAAPQPNPIFTAEAARASLEASLRALRTDHIDLWLLHEVRAIDLPANAAEDELLRFMESAVRDGKVGMIGVGSDREAAPALLNQHPGYCQAVQQEWSVFDPLGDEDAAFHLYHRALSSRFGTLLGELKANAPMRKRWSEATGQDLASAGTLARLMLRASYVLHPNSIVLFSSKDKKHIGDNVAVAGDASLDGAARALYQLVRQEQANVL